MEVAPSAVPGLIKSGFMTGGDWGVCIAETMFRDYQRQVLPAITAVQQQGSGDGGGTK